MFWGGEKNAAVYFSLVYETEDRMW